MRRFFAALLIIVAGIAITAAILLSTGIKYAYELALDNVISLRPASPEAYDLWGRGFTRQEAARLMQTTDGRSHLLPQNGAVKIDSAPLA